MHVLIRRRKGRPVLLGMQVRELEAEPLTTASPTHAISNQSLRVSSVAVLEELWPNLLCHSLPLPRFASPVAASFVAARSGLSVASRVLHPPNDLLVAGLANPTPLVAS